MKISLCPGCLVFVILLLLTSCDNENDTNPIFKDSKVYTIVSNDGIHEIDLKDSLLLTHLRGQFYRSKNCTLFERTIAAREMGGDSLTDVEYFNGNIPQDLDPFTFVPLDGWYAIDKKSAYCYRPTSDGMLIVKLDSADAASFKVVKGDYRYAVDKKAVYEESVQLKGLDAANLRIVRNKNGNVVNLISGNFSHEVISVEE